MEKFDVRKAVSLESQYDDALKTRPISAWLGTFVFLFSIAFALYHYITSGIGVPVDYWHMGAHMSGVLVLIFISFPALKSMRSATKAANSWWHFGGVPVYDWLLIIAGVAASLYVGFSWYGFEFNIFGYVLSVPEQVLRMGVPLPIDVVFGTILIIVLLEAVRRTIGIIVPII